MLVIIGLVYYKKPILVSTFVSLPSSPSLFLIPHESKKHNEILPPNNPAPISLEMCRKKVYQECEEKLKDYKSTQAIGQVQSISNGIVNVTVKRLKNVLNFVSSKCHPLSTSIKIESL